MALVRETVALMQTYALEKEVTLRLQNDTENSEKQKLELSVDSRAIQQALINLIDNAIKHSPKNAEIAVSLSSCSFSFSSSSSAPSDAGHVGSLQKCRISAQDKGAGIPLAEQEKIFERFYRIGSELRRETQGVGIGLSIVKHVAEAHGGRVLVQSAPGQGSRFTIELPLGQRVS